MIKGKWMEFRNGNVTNSYSANSNPSSKDFSSWQAIRNFVNWVQINNPNVRVEWK